VTSQGILLGPLDALACGMWGQLVYLLCNINFRCRVASRPTRDRSR